MLAAHPDDEHARKQQSRDVRGAVRRRRSPRRSPRPRRQALAQDWSKLDPPRLVREFEDVGEPHAGRVRPREPQADGVRRPRVERRSFETLKPKLGEERAQRRGRRTEPRGQAAARRRPRRRRSATSPPGAIDRAAFLERFGHRGTNEMELAQPRWSEAPEELDRLVRRREGRAHGRRLAVDVGDDRRRGEARPARSATSSSSRSSGSARTSGSARPASTTC